MKGLHWVAVDERYPSTSLGEVSDLVCLAPEHFSAVAFPIAADAPDILTPALQLRQQFGVSVVPIIWEASLLSDADAILARVSELAGSDAMVAARGCPPTVLVMPRGQCATTTEWAQPLRRALSAAGAVRIGTIDQTGALTGRIDGYDFSVYWPPAASSASHDARGVPDIEALDLAIGATRHTAEAGSRAFSVLIGTGSDDFHEAHGARITGLTAPVSCLWLDSVRRFASNRPEAANPFAFIRLTGQRGSPLPSWLRAAFASTARSSWLAPEPAAPVAVPQATGIRSRIAVVIHLYYPDIWPEFNAAIDAIPEAADVYISTPAMIADAVRARVNRDRPEAVVFGVRNIGRDVLPFLHVLRSVGTERYEYVLKLHSKKSLHLEDADAAAQFIVRGEDWRHRAIMELAGSREQVSSLLGLMDADESTGLLAPSDQLLDQHAWLCGTGDLQATLRRGLRLRVEADVFPAGTMFWLRPAAITALVEADPGLLDFEREAGDVDCTLHHAIERVIAHCVASAGYRIRDTSAVLRGE